jgi:3-isopropylmalate/(R)-2-methylmalate dehydratase large subunit
MMNKPQTLFEKIWNRHVVAQEPDSPAVLYIDRHLIHEVTTPQAFTGLRERNLKVRRPEKILATIDHSVPTRTDGSSAGRLAYADEMSARQIHQMEENCRLSGIPLYGLENANQGIIHVIAPELGATHPGMTIVCGDSHTATHGAFGALAFGIGTSEVEHVLATQCLLQRQPKTFRVEITGRLLAGVTAKDIILGLIQKIGVNGGTGYVLEYCGDAVRALSMEGRMTLCNMSIEAGARAGLIAPNDVTYEYLAGRPFSPKGEAWEQILAAWRQLPSDAGAVFDKSITWDVSSLEPMITFGTNPGMSIIINQKLPLLQDAADLNQRSALEKAYNYMGLRPGSKLAGQRVDVVFIGSCTNGRLSDLQIGRAHV